MLFCITAVHRIDLIPEPASFSDLLSIIWANLCDKLDVRFEEVRKQVTLNLQHLDLVLLHQLTCTFLSPVDWFGPLTVLDIRFRHQQITGIIGESGLRTAVLGVGYFRHFLPDYVARSGYFLTAVQIFWQTTLPARFLRTANRPDTSQNPGDCSTRCAQ